MIARLRGDRSVKEICREHEIAETRYYSWREKLLEGGKTALAGKVSGPARKSCGGGSASSSALWVAKRMSWK